MIGIQIKHTIGIGDALLFSAIPENYFNATGKMLIDETRHWIFDHNPYVVRNYSEVPSKSYSLWNYTPQWFPKDRHSYTCQIEQFCGAMGIPVTVRHPRLYIFEDYPISNRTKILLQTQGRSHGKMPDYVINHVLAKYAGMPLFQLGFPEEPDIGIPKLVTPSIWDLAREISQSRIVICMDSGPSWIAACYPDVVIKKLRSRPSMDILKDWVPLATNNLHAIWDDLQLMQIYNPSEVDVGFTSSYKRI